MNKFLLFLMLASGFLLIIYANSDIFSKHFLQFKKNVPKSTETSSTPTSNIISPVPTPRAEAIHAPPMEENTDPDQEDFNIFLIYTKENYQLQKKFELFTKSLLKFSTVDKLHLHIISDRKSEVSAEKILKEQIEHYRLVSFCLLLGTFYLNFGRKVSFTRWPISIEGISCFNNSDSWFFIIDTSKYMSLRFIGKAMLVLLWVDVQLDVFLTKN